MEDDIFGGTIPEQKIVEQAEAAFTDFESGRTDLPAEEAWDPFA